MRKLLETILIIICAFFCLITLFVWICFIISIFTVNNEMSSVLTEETIIESPLITSKPTPESTKTNLIQKEIIEYNKWASPFFKKLSLLFEKIAVDCEEYNLASIKKDFKELEQIRANFEKKEYPDDLELFQLFYKDMTKMFLEWDNVYISLLDNDAFGVALHSTNAACYMEESTELYTNILDKYEL